MKKFETVENLISYMKSKNIRFELCSESEACRFLTENSYYKKISCYQDIFQYGIKNGHRVYADLDFAYLQELSTLDMEFRVLVMGMCLNLEHALKIYILRECLNSGDDGYSFVDEYFTVNDKARDGFSTLTNNPYCRDLVTKYSTDTPIWVYLEVISFGSLCAFYRWLAKEKGVTDYGDTDIIYDISRFRNAAAHNYCLFNHLRKRDRCKPKPRVLNFVKSIAPPGENTSERMKSQCAHDFFTLLYAFDKYIESDGIKNHTAGDIKQLFGNRMQSHSEYFKNCETITKIYTFSKKALDNWINSL